MDLIWLELILNSREHLPDGAVPDERLTLYKYMQQPGSLQQLAKATHNHA